MTNVDTISSKLIRKPVNQEALKERDRIVYRFLYPISTERWPALTPFYVGKGFRERPKDHLRGAKIYLNDGDFERQLNKEKNPFKLRVIRKILKSGHVPIVEIAFTGLTVDEANALEVYEIARIGRFDLGLGPLTNLTNGGEGTVGYRRPDEVKERDRQREADPFKRQLKRIKHRALMRFPEIKERQHANQAKAFLRQEVKEARANSVKKCVNRGKTSRDKISPDILDLYTKEWTSRQIAVHLDLPLNRVQRVLTENIPDYEITRHNLDVSHVLELYKSGWTITRIVTHLKVSRYTVNDIILKGIGSLKERNVKFITPQIVSLFKEGHKISAISEQFSVSTRVVNDILKNSIGHVPKPGRPLGYRINL